MKKSGNFSEELCTLLGNRINGYSNSDTIEGRFDALTDIFLDLLLMLKKKKVFTKKELRRLEEKYRKWN